LELRSEWDKMFHSGKSWLKSFSSIQFLARAVGVKYVDDAQVGGSSSHRQLAPGLSHQPAKASCRQIFHAFWKLYSPYFCDKKSRWKAWPLLVIVMVFMFCEVQTGIDISNAIKDVNNALVGKDKTEFYKELRTAVFIGLRLVPILVLHLGAAFYISLDWRKFLTQKVLDMYVNDVQCYYRLKMEYGNVDNPDQRIAQDIGNFCRMSLRLMSSIIQDIMKIAANSIALIQISSTLFYALVGCSVGYTVFSLLVFAAPLMRVQRRILAVEGDLRYVLVRLRENAESIAFFRGHGYERQCSEKVLDHVIWSNYKRCAIEVAYKTFTGLVTLCFILLPMMIVAPMYLRGLVSFGVIQQTQMLFHSLMSGMMDIGKELDSFARLGAESVRVQELWDALAKIQRCQDRHGKMNDDSSTTVCESDAESSAGSFSDSDIENSSLDSSFVAHVGAVTLEELEVTTPVRLQLCSVTLYPPLSHEPLMCDLSLTVKQGDSLLLEGASGTGKSSLLRAIAGLWSRGSGTIRRTRLDRCFFLPQAPYLCLGSLRDNVLYPRDQTEVDVTSDQIIEVLGSLGISHLLDRHGLDMDLDFSNVLSGGERQRLGFARLLLRDDIELALLDEATSALDDENELIAYQLLKKKVHCYVSVGHRASLVANHSTRLQLTRPSKSDGDASGVHRPEAKFHFGT